MNRLVALVVVLVIPALVEAAEFRSVAQAARVLGQAQDPLDRIDAANWLGKWQGEAFRPAAEALATALADTHPSVRRAVLNGLVHLGAKKQAPRLRARLEVESDSDVLPALLLALGRLGTPADGPAIDRFAHHAAPGVRAAVIGALSYLPHDLARVRAMEALTLADRDDPNWAMRSAALLALGRVGEPDDLIPAAAAFAEGGGQRFWFARAAYARLIATLAANPLATLLDLVRDDDFRVAVTAAEGLVRSGHAEALIDLLSNSESAVRLAAIGGIEQTRLLEALPRLRARARRDTSASVRWAAARALFRLEDPLGEQLVLLGVTAREPAVWADALALLHERTGEEHGRDVAAWRRALEACRRR